MHSWQALYALFMPKSVAFTSQFPTKVSILLLNVGRIESDK